jgi:hypothetical protein
MGEVSPKLVLSDRQQKAVLDATFALDELQRHAFLGSLTGTCVTRVTCVTLAGSLCAATTARPTPAAACRVPSLAAS